MNERMKDWLRQAVSESGTEEDIANNFDYWLLNGADGFLAKTLWRALEIASGSRPGGGAEERR